MSLFKKCEKDALKKDPPKASVSDKGKDASDKRHITLDNALVIGATLALIATIGIGIVTTISVNNEIASLSDKMSAIDAEATATKAEIDRLKGSVASDTSLTASDMARAEETVKADMATIADAQNAQSTDSVKTLQSFFGNSDKAATPWFSYGTPSEYSWSAHSYQYDSATGTYKCLWICMPVADMDEIKGNKVDIKADGAHAFAYTRAHYDVKKKLWTFDGTYMTTIGVAYNDAQLAAKPDTTNEDNVKKMQEIVSESQKNNPDDDISKPGYRSPDALKQGGDQ